MDSRIQKLEARVEKLKESHIAFGLQPISGSNSTFSNEEEMAELPEAIKKSRKNLQAEVEAFEQSEMIRLQFEAKRRARKNASIEF